MKLINKERMGKKFNVRWRVRSIQYKRSEGELHTCGKRLRGGKAGNGF